MQTDLCFSFDRIRKSCTRLNAIALKRIARFLDRLDVLTNTAAVLTPQQSLFFWVSDLSLAFPLTDPEQQKLIVEEFQPDLDKFAIVLWESMSGRPGRPKLPVAYIGLGDRRYATITGRDSLLDLSTGESISGTKVQFLETIQYNLCTLFVTKHLICKHQDEPRTETT